MAFQITLMFMSFFFVMSFAKPDFGNHQHSSPFDFIKNLQGYEKGSYAPALHDLKLYLSRFGYLNYKNIPYQINSENHYFDDDLETALKCYQNFYHLNPTGTLDEHTVSQMLMPRCGHPDIKTNQHNTKKYSHTVSLYKLFPGLLKWPEGKTNLTYAFYNFPNAYIPPVVRAFNSWACASSGYFTFTRVEDINSADLKIGFERGEAAGFDGPYGVLAHASVPTGGVLQYDVDENWSIGPGPIPSTIDIETVSLHEIGHLLGLNHSQDKNATMWAVYTGFATCLDSDDIQGLKALYGLA